MDTLSLDALVAKFRTDVAGRWHDERRKGNDGSAGNTLEDLLGVAENNLKLPDWGEIELKTKRKESQSLLTLMHREPIPNGSIPKLITSLGWRHREAGKKYPWDEMSFRSTTQANSFSSRGFSVSLEDNRVTFVFDPTKVAVHSKDATGVYTTYGDWLKDVQTRAPHYSSVLPVYWEKTFVLDEIRNKLDNTLFCLCESRTVNGVRQFKFDSAILLKGFDPSRVDQLFIDHALYVDIDARSRHNHGTKFRVNLSSVKELFESAVEVL